MRSHVGEFSAQWFLARMKVSPPSQPQLKKWDQIRTNESFRETNENETNERFKKLWYRIGGKMKQENLIPNDLMRVKDIEVTSWKVRAYGIFTRVGAVSEIERVRFLILHQRFPCCNLFILYILRFSRPQKYILALYKFELRTTRVHRKYYVSCQNCPTKLPPMTAKKPAKTQFA